jgi:AcrR family transcriptional regulator
VPRERADAARNRVRILDAAARLFATRGVSEVSMDDIAAEAGVGKGTVYRRFTDRGELAVALLGSRAEALQHHLLGGDPPLGPGAPPSDRLVAFVEEYLAFQARNLELVLLSETSSPGARLRKGSYALWRRHCAFLLTQSGVDDAVVRAEVILAGCSAEQVNHWLHVEGRSEVTLHNAMAGLARALASSPGR